MQSLMLPSREARARRISTDLWMRRGLIAVSVVFVLLSVLAGWNWSQAIRAEAKAKFRESLYLAEQARQQLNDNLPVTAMQIALAGLPENPDSRACPRIRMGHLSTPGETKQSARCSR